MLARASACGSPSSPTTTTRMLGGITEHVHGQARELARARPRGDRRHGSPAAHARRSPTRTRARTRDEGVRGRPRSASACRSTATPRRRSTPCPPGSSLQLRSLFKRLEVDVVHLHAPYNPSMCAIAPLAIPDGAIGVGDLPLGLRARACCSTSSRRSCGAGSASSTRTSSSPRPASARSRRTSRTTTAIIPNGIDDRHFSPDAEPLPELREGGKPLILFLGRFDPRNGLPTMLEAFEQVHARARGIGAAVRRRRRAAAATSTGASSPSAWPTTSSGPAASTGRGRATTPRPTSTARPASAPRSAWCCSRR